MVVASEEEAAEKAMSDNDGVLTTGAFLHVSVQSLKEH